MGRRFVIAGLLGLALAVGAARGDDEIVRVDVVQAAPVHASPRLDEVFKSIQNGGKRDGEEKQKLMPVFLGVVALVMMAAAIGQWNRRRAERPKPRGDHRKLLDELARATGLSRRQLRKLAPAARAGGISSPAVAAICPSVLLRLAGEARSGTERSAWAALSRAVAGRRR